jgi:hypothetical protein
MRHLGIALFAIAEGPGWPLHAASAWFGHTKLETTAKYLNVTTQYLPELNEREPLTSL